MTRENAVTPPAVVADSAEEDTDWASTPIAPLANALSTMPTVAAAAPSSRPVFSVAEPHLPPPPATGERAIERSLGLTCAATHTHPRSRMRFVVSGTPAEPRVAAPAGGHVQRRLFSVAEPPVPQRCRDESDAVAREGEPVSAPKRKRVGGPSFVVQQDAACGRTPPPPRRRMSDVSFAVAGERDDALGSPSKTARLDAAALVIAGGSGRTQPEQHAPAAASSARRAVGPLQAALQAARGDARRSLALLRGNAVPGEGGDDSSAVACALAAALAVRVERVAATGALLIGVAVVRSADGSVAAGDALAVRADAEDESIGPGDFVVVPAPWTVLYGEGERVLSEVLDDVQAVVLAPLVGVFPARLLDDTLAHAFAASPSVRKRSIARRASMRGSPAPVGPVLGDSCTRADDMVGRHTCFSTISPRERVVELSLRVVTWSAEIELAVVRDANGQFGFLKGLPSPSPPPNDAPTLLGLFQVASESLPLAAFKTVMSQLGVTKDRSAATQRNFNSENISAAHSYNVPVFVHLPPRS